MTAEKQLRDGLKALAVDGPDDSIEGCLSYLALIERWNRVTNLTAITDRSEMVSRHLLDSLSIHHYLSGQAIIDVGSGAGLPGIPLALFNPGKDFILLDSNGKKTRFMTQAVIDLGLENVTVAQSRAESFTGSFDHVVSRAFRSLGEMVISCSHLLRPGGSFLAMKGPDAPREIAELDTDHWRATCYPLSVPGVPGDRCLVTVSGAGVTA